LDLRLIVYKTKNLEKITFLIASFFCVICVLFSPGEHYHADARFLLSSVRSEICRDSYDALTTAGSGEFFNHFDFKKETLMVSTQKNFITIVHNFKRI